MYRTITLFFTIFAFLSGCSKPPTAEERAKYANKESQNREVSPDTVGVEEIEVEMGTTTIPQEHGRPPKLQITTSHTTEIPSVMNFSYYKSGGSSEKQKTTITIGEAVIIEYSRGELLPSKTELPLTTDWSLINSGCKTAVLQANSSGHLIEVFLESGSVVSVGVAGAIYSNSPGARTATPTTDGYHVVVRNETLNSISKKYNLNLPCLIARYPGSLSIGEKIDVRECK